MGALCAGRRAPPQGRTRDREAAQAGRRGLAREDRRARRSPRRSGARRGAITWRAIATMRTGWSADAPTCATARWWICRSLARGDGDGQRVAPLHGQGRHRESWPRRSWKALCADCSGGIDSLVELLQGRFSKGGDGAHLPSGYRLVSDAHRKFASRAAARTMRRCASMSRPCSTALARGSTTALNCCFACGRSTRPKCCPISRPRCRTGGRSATERTH